jgi:hypothetical protein
VINDAQISSDIVSLCAVISSCVEKEKGNIDPHAGEVEDVVAASCVAATIAHEAHVKETTNGGGALSAGFVRKSHQKDRGDKGQNECHKDTHSDSFFGI